MSYGFLMKTYLLIEYYTYQKSYIEKFCENKDRPELDCKGKCHLSQSLNTSATDDSEGVPRPTLIESLELSHCTLESQNELKNIFVSSELIYPDYIPGILNGYSNKIHHPPELI